MSPADELSVNNETAGRRVKQEVATPKAVEETGDTTADEGTGRRHRRTLRVAVSPHPVTKRKRAESLEAPESTGPPTHVLWTRAFPKMSASTLEQIGGLRSASTFAHPVKERDAPGYRNLILRPQDLKSIRSAITAGNRAAAAVVPDDAGQSSLLLPISEDLVPPKGIINYAQLEKELMRMFANAIMFNADPDRGVGRPSGGRRIKADELEKGGYQFDEDRVVKDTRAMFADVERILDGLRSAERRSEEVVEGDDDEADELAGDTEGGGSGTAAKRRRKA